MIVEQIWTGNAYRNFNYLIVCPASGEALAIDPLEFHKCLSQSRERGWEITQILNTHEHGDHIGGNKGLVEATGAKIIAHKNAAARIPSMDRGVGAGDVIKVGKHVELECLDTPGHTMSHICLLAHSEEPALFSGDTLFNAGAGNCHSGGHPEALYETFVSQLARLDASTRVYPGHEYLANNLHFTLDREPDNDAAAKLLAEVDSMDPEHPVVTTLALEKEINTFFRLRSRTLIDRLREDFADLPENPSPKEVFLALRQLRNTW